MSTVEWLPLLAFLAPLPPPRPERPRSPPDHAWLAGFLMLATVFTMVAPMVAIWAFHRPDTAIRAACEASGGSMVERSISGDGPARCRRE